MAASKAKGTAELLKNAVIHNASGRHSATTLLRTMPRRKVEEAWCGGSGDETKPDPLLHKREDFIAEVIFLHGLGDTGHGWAVGLNEIKQSYMKLICPTAATIPVTLNGGFRMPAWFDIYSLDRSGQQDEAGILKATENVHELLEAEQKSTGIPSNRIVLGGFSQGGALAMFSALTYGKQLGGILALSAAMPLYHILGEKMKAENKEIPFLHCHGELDEMVSFEYGQRTAQFVQTFNKTNHQFKSYGGLGHSSSPQEMNDVQAWLNEVLPPFGGNM